jgi:hypothetical protein
MKDVFYIDLTRLSDCGKQTLGDMVVVRNNQPVYRCKTIELPWKENKRRVSCIPKGRYEVVKRVSPKHGNHFHITNVPGRDWVLIHSGNFSRQLLGCIAPGKAHIDIDGDGLRDVSSSRVTMNELNALLPERFILEIK